PRRHREAGDHDHGEHGEHGERGERGEHGSRTHRNLHYVKGTAADGGSEGLEARPAPPSGATLHSTRISVASRGRLLDPLQPWGEPGRRHGRRITTRRKPCLEDRSSRALRCSGSSPWPPGLTRRTSRKGGSARSTSTASRPFASMPTVP